MPFFLRRRTPLPVVAYALYLYLSGLSLRRVCRAISPFIRRSHEAVRRWLGLFSLLGEALHAGRAKVAIVDERYVYVAGEQPWIWLAMEPRSRRLLAVRLSWTKEHPGRV